MTMPWEDYAHKPTAQSAPPPVTPSQGGDAPWEDYAPVTSNRNIAAQGAVSEQGREALRESADAMSGRDPGIDYKSGIPSAMFRAGFSRMSNDAEKSNYLDKFVGAGLWGKDTAGAYFIKPQALKKFGVTSDIPVSIDEQTATRYDVADVAGDLPAIAGATGLGMAATGAGAIPGMALAAIGGAGGKAIDEIVKNFQGYQRKDAGDVATTLAKEGGMAALGEGVSRALIPVGKAIIGPGASRMTPEKAELAKTAIDQGFKIRPGSVTDAPILARWEGMVKNIFGDLHKETNERAAKAGVDRLTGMAGTAASKEAAGEAVSSSIRAKRVNFSRMMEGKYSAVDDIVGGNPIIPTDIIKAKASELLDALPKTAEGKAIGGGDTMLKDILKMGDRITVGQAQRLRTLLREASESTNLVPDVSKYEARGLKDAVEETFNSATNKKTIGGAVTDANTANALKKLRQTDELYKSGIMQFDNSVVSAITRNQGKAGAVDADMVVDYLIKPERIVRLRAVKNMVPPEQWAKVKAAHAADLLQSVQKGTDDPLVNIFDGKAFRSTLDKYGKEVLNEVHGKEWTDAAYNYANSLMLASKQMSLSGGIVAANIALHPVKNLPKLVWLRALSQVMEQPGTFKYLTEGIKLGDTTKVGLELMNRVASQASVNARDETGSSKFTVDGPE